MTAIRRLWTALGLSPVSLPEVIERKRLQCALALLDAEEDLDSAGCRVAALRIRLERLSKQCAP